MLWLAKWRHSYCTCDQAPTASVPCCCVCCRSTATAVSDGTQPIIHEHNVTNSWYGKSWVAMNYLMRDIRGFIASSASVAYWHQMQNIWCGCFKPSLLHDKEKIIKSTGTALNVYIFVGYKSFRQLYCDTIHKNGWFYIRP